jgi:uncharacterized membrane protein YuzA (DUF378 family)
VGIADNSTFFDKSDRELQMVNKVLDWTAIILLIIGGINLGITGLFDYDVIVAMFSDSPMTARIVFFVIGIAALYMCYSLYREIQRELPPPPA